MATNDTSVEPKIPEDSRYSLLTDALDQASHKIVKKILRFITILQYNLMLS